MIGPSQILDIGKRSLFAHQYALSVTSHNIANVNTPGYSRQRAIFNPTPPLNILGLGPVGTGVEISKIERMRSTLIDFQIRDQFSQVGEWERADELLKQIESLVNEPSEQGLANAITEFFAAWLDVVKDPEENGPRRVLVERAKILSNMFHRSKNQLGAIAENLNAEIEAKVNDINYMSSQIARLNKQIVAQESAGKMANDLRDERDKLVDELAKLTDIQTAEQEDGSLTVFMNYKIIVDHMNTVELGTRMEENNDMKLLYITYEGKKVIPDSGELKGIMDVRENKIVRYRTQLDELAKNIIDEVNAVHSTGYGLTGISGKDFFKGYGADTIAVNSEFENNLSLIAASVSGSPGDGENAQKIADLAYKLVMGGDNQFTFSDFYRALVAELGSASEYAGNMKESEKVLLTQLQNYRESVKGVSLDEEFVNMINYQHAFEAAGKVIQTADQLFDTILSLK